jgi:hypothetical protein
VPVIGERLQHVAAARPIRGAACRNALKLGGQPFEAGNPRPRVGKLFRRDPVCLGAGGFGVVRQVKQGAVASNRICALFDAPLRLLPG